MTVNGGLRERKKADTRRRLVEVADRLFFERGFQSTTLADICAELPVHVQTLLRYFPSKEDLALATLNNPQALSERIHDSLGAGNVFEVLRVYCSDAAAILAADPKMVDRWMKLAAEPQLKGAMSAASDEFVEVIAQALLTQHGTRRPSERGACLVAAAFVHGNQLVTRRWYDGRRDTDLNVEWQAVVDDVQRMWQSLSRRDPPFEPSRRLYRLR